MMDLGSLFPGLAQMMPGQGLTGGGARPQATPGGRKKGKFDPKKLNTYYDPQKLSMEMIMGGPQFMGMGRMDPTAPSIESIFGGKGMEAALGKAFGQNPNRTPIEQTGMGGNLFSKGGGLFGQRGMTLNSNPFGG
jgi:hypothetical protein